MSRGRGPRVGCPLPEGVDGPYPYCPQSYFLLTRRISAAKQASILPIAISVWVFGHVGSNACGIVSPRALAALEVENQLEPGGLLDEEAGRLPAFQNPAT